MGVCSAWVALEHWVPPSLRAPPPLPSLFCPPPHPSLSCWLTVSQTSWPDAALGVSPAAVSPITRTSGRPAGSSHLPTHSQGNGSLPTPATHAGLGLIVCQLLWPTGRLWRGQGGSVRELSQVPGEPAATEAITHCILSCGALCFCPDLPQGVRWSATDLRGSGNFPARATQATHVPPHPQLGDPGEETLSPVKWAVERIGGDQAAKCLAHCLAHSKLVESVPLWAAASSLPPPSLQ